MTSNIQITLTSVTQNRLTITGGYNVTVSQPSPSGDGFYDSTTTVIVYANSEWDNTQNSKQTLSSYTLDGITSNVSPTTPQVAIEVKMDKAHELVLSSVRQFLVLFTIKDNAGREALTHEVLQIVLGNGSVEVNGSVAWLAEQSQFKVGSVIWQGVDVKPQTQES
jgi:hypothetical protein